MNAPKKITVLIAAILGVLGLLGSLIAIPFISTISFWLVLAGLVLMIVASFVKGL